MSVAAEEIIDPLNPHLLDGLRIISNIRERGEEALSEYAACVVPLLNALGWTGRRRHLAEAVPHFIDNIQLDEFRETLANINLRTFPVVTKQSDLNPGLLPCLFVPDKGSVRVVLSREKDGCKIYDGAKRDIRICDDRQLNGTAYVVRAVENRADLPGDNAAWLAEILIRFRSLIWQVFLATLAINLLSIATPVFMMSLYDIVIPSASIQQLSYLVGGVAVAVCIEWMFRKLRSAVMAFAAGRIDYLIGTASFQRVLLLPIAMTENEPLGAQISHLQEFESVREFFAGPLGETLFDLPFVILFVAVITWLSGWLALVPICGAAILVLGSMLAAPFVKRNFSQGAKARTEQQRFLIEAVSGMRAIKFAGAERVWARRYRSISASSAMGDFRISMANQIIQAFGRFVMMGAGIAMVGFGAEMAMGGSLTIGALVASMALGWRVLSPFQSLLTMLTRATQIRSSLNQINHLMRMKAERVAGKVPPKRTLRGRVMFLGVGYRHVPDSDPALNGVSFKIEPGEVVAITGANGSGKSTLVNLAAGLYRAQVGSVVIDGVDLRQIDPIDLRQTIGFAPQSSELLYGTVSQNMRLSIPWASDEEIREAARMADVDKAIMELPEGYETRLTERVISELPEGIKQRLSIARALIRKPPLLIFDEPGQMIDQRGDNAFISAVQNLRGKSTILIVTHRPSHMRIADRLIVLNAGRVQYNGEPKDALDAVDGVA